jgi:hypothetical protein
MSTYSTEDFQKIAAKTGKGLPLRYANRLEAAAAWYRAYCRAPKSLRPADTSKRMRQIANAARMLLRQLEIYDYRKAPDGPGDITLLEFLVPAEHSSEDEIIQATGQIGRLAEIFDAIDAAELLEESGGKAAEAAKHLSRLVSIKGRRGDYATNVWLAEMMSLYKALTQKEPRISVIPSGSKRGKPGGPFLKFLEAARGPAEWDGKKPLCLDRVREQVRTIRNQRRK